MRRISRKLSESLESIYKHNGHEEHKYWYLGYLHGHISAAQIHDHAFYYRIHDNTRKRMKQQKCNIWKH